MFSSLARLRVVLFTTFFFAFFASAREDKLFTSSVTYCRPPESLLVQQFDVTYFARNRSVSFNITAASVIPNLDVTANLFLNAYGMKPVNLTVDFCTILGGALCPLPIHDFAGHASLTIPDEFSDRIPGIAYKVPDLEAFAQLMLTERDTGDVKACVQATLANGWSTHQPAVEWTTGGITLATFLVALWQSRSPNSILPFRLLDMILFYQSIASSAFLSINYPSLYRSFTLNFGWSMSLFTTRSAAVQFAINDMRARTGGGLANSTTNSAVGLVNRKLSPFNDFAAALPVRQATPEMSLYYSRIYNAARNYTQPLAESIPLRQLAADSNAVQTVTQDSSNVLQAGVPIYVNSLHIATANAFMTVFICALVLIGIALFVFGVAFAALFVMERFKLGQDDMRSKLRYSYTPLIRAWSLRLALIMFFPIVVFALYQWTLDDSWLSVLFSVISFIAIMAGISYVFFLIFRQVRRSDTSALYSNSGFLQSHGPVYARYRNPRYYFFLVFIVGAFLKALFIAAAKSNGLAQVILILLVEIGTFVALLALRPHKTRGGDVFSSFLTVIRIVCTGLLLAFVESFGVQPIPRVAIGAVIAVIFSVSIIIIIINLIFNLGIRRLWRRQKDDGKPSRPTSRQESADVMLEKGPYSPHSDSESTITRAKNPTPDHNIPLDPEINRPYPATPTTAHSPTEYASTHARDSASTNFGSVLPRRWSITPLHTPTSSSVDHLTAVPQAGIMARTSEATEPPSPGLQTGKDLHTHSN